MRQKIIIPAALYLGLFCSGSVIAEIALNPSAESAQQPTTNLPNAPVAPNQQAPVNTQQAVEPVAPPPIATSELAPLTNDQSREQIKNAVVKVHVVKHTYNTLTPWNSETQKGSGSGLIIGNNLILTNAHVAANATFLEVQRHGETERHQAEVVYISHESDLALLRPKDPTIYKNIKPLELGDLPKMQQQVEVYGFPIGGNTLSVTRGVVSRIEKQNYVHTGENLIAVQVDAAINFGNSGGPVISDGKVVGVAMQSGMLTDNIGYMIPTPIIRHVLEDIKDGKVDGYGFHGFLAESMDNPAMRKRYGMKENQTGMLIHKVYKHSPADGKIMVGDIMTAIDGHKVENNGTVEFRSGEFIDHTHYIDMHQIGENLKITVLRNGKEETVSLLLDKPGKEYLLVKPNQYDKQQDYFIFGGLVFMPLNQDVLDAFESTPARLGALTNEVPDENRDEAVVLMQVLPAEINKDYQSNTKMLIEKVDGNPVKNFRDFFNKIQAATGDYITIEGTDNYQIVLDRKEAITKQPDILRQYGISSDRSKDLQDLTAPAQPAATPAVAPATTTAPAAPSVVAPATTQTAPAMH